MGKTTAATEVAKTNCNNVNNEANVQEMIAKIKEARKGSGTIWIAVTGLDGSGKTTLVDNLEKAFIEAGIRVKRTRSPHDEYLTKELLNVSNDPLTDRMLFALDNRILGTRIKEWQKSGEYDVILSQRCFLDSFVHGLVQGYSYEAIESINHFIDLPKVNYMIHLNCDADIAFERICDDPDADKFEYPVYIQTQADATKKVYQDLMNRNIDLANFYTARNVYFETSHLTTDELYQKALEWIVQEVRF